jgi:hypothetical protein
LRDLSARSVGVIERICGELMEELGYVRAARYGAGPGARIALHDGLSRLREGLDWQLQRMLRKV